MQRCAWVKLNEPLYVQYHDDEWGVPIYDDQRLFEMLCLEGAQAGLSWWTILQKREGYRQAFDGFDPSQIVLYTEDKLIELSQDARIVRNKLKIASVRTNAQAFLRVQEQYGSFSHYLWRFVDHHPIMNQWSTIEGVPTTTVISDNMSKQLKKDGFKFVGSTILYSFMQAVGMVNDHTQDCFCYREQMTPSIE
ncbi:DNA-3-methyladenine glycosylase I [Lysinibacillus sp. 54212]|uniref:DNA-3-methyladenine glycosylase I n=1 Tax=Lysinibacillus sp. 54212 TaxID=3119829 RepID=UPI002FC948B9